MARRGDGIYLRGKTWWLDFIHKGRRHVVRLGSGISKTRAREIATMKRGQCISGDEGVARKRKDISFDTAAEEFLTWTKANKRPKTVKCYNEYVKQLRRTFSGKRLGDIHPFVIEKHKKMRVEENAKVAVNRELAILKAIFNKCVSWKKFEGANPVREVKQLKEPKSRLRYLDHEEEGRLLDTTEEPLRTVILVGIYTGLRIRSEALSLEWQDVDTRNGLLNVRAAYAKSGEARSVPLNSLVRGALDALRARRPGSSYVFTKRDGTQLKSVRTAFQNACRRANLMDVTLHTLRHTFASRLAMSGVDLRTIQELGGWKNLDMVQRYSHLSPNHKAEAVERLVQQFHNAIPNSAENAAEKSAVTI